MIRYARTRWYRLLRGEDIFDVWPGADGPRPVSPRSGGDSAGEDRRLAVRA
ncbi:MAG: hypothetical protein QOE37_2160 [Microbacteriaceae bacterium]|nr:hypothetical protein [Microbacteriaceae bacterium]